MLRGIVLVVTGCLVAPLTGVLVRSLVHSQRLGPGAAHPELMRPTPVAPTRRTFVRWATLGALAVAGAQASLVVTRFAWPMKTGIFGGEVAVPLRDLPAIGGPPLRHQAGRFYLMRDTDGLLAFSWTCTHLGCVVPWQPAEGRFHCPCHHSLFDRQGLVVGGPATRPLDLLPIRLVGTSVIVDTGANIGRADFEPGQVTPLA